MTHGSSRRLVLYEDRHWRSLRPLTDLLPVPALAFGASDLARRWIAHAGFPLHAIEARSHAMAGWRDRPAASAGPASEPGAGDQAEAIVVNAAALPGPWFAQALESRAPSLWMGESRVAGARLPLASLRGGLGRSEDFETVLLGLGLPALGVDAEFITWTWELMARNSQAIEHDLAGGRGALQGEVHRLACIESPERVTVEAGATVGAFALLDASTGPILVRRGARIEPHAREGAVRRGRGHAAPGRCHLQLHVRARVPDRGRGGIERVAGLRQ
jgi:hypothetical protein